MFGRTNVVPVVDLRNTPDEVGRCSDGAVKRLLDVTEHPKIVWSLSNAFTSAFKDLDPIPQFKTTAKLSSFLDLATASSI